MAKRRPPFPRKKYYELTPEIRKTMKSIRTSLSCIEMSTHWSFCLDANKAYARMCADLIVDDAHMLYREFEKAGIGFRDGKPLFLRLPDTRSNNV